MVGLMMAVAGPIVQKDIKKPVLGARIEQTLAALPGTRSSAIDFVQGTAQQCLSSGWIRKYLKTHFPLQVAFKWTNMEKKSETRAYQIDFQGSPIDGKQVGDISAAVETEWRKQDVAASAVQRAREATANATCYSLRSRSVLPMNEMDEEDGTEGIERLVSQSSSALDHSPICSGVEASSPAAASLTDDSLVATVVELKQEVKRLFWAIFFLPMVHLEVLMETADRDAERFLGSSAVLITA